MKKIINRKIRIGLVGCGRISKNHFDSIEKHQEKIELVSICDDDQSVLTVHEKKYNIKDEHIVEGIKSVKNTRGRLQIIDKGSLKKLAPSNTLICDVAHNPSAGLAISNYLNTLDKNDKPFIITDGVVNVLPKLGQ